MKHLPPFSRQARFFDVAGVPVSFDPGVPDQPGGVALAWDTRLGRSFAVEALDGAMRIDFSDFVALIALHRTRTSARIEGRLTAEMPAIPQQGWTEAVLARLG